MTQTPDPGHDPLVAGRRRHHQEIIDSVGYPHRYERTHKAAQLHEEHEGLAPGSETDVRVSVAGRLMLYRSFGRLQFGTLRDDSGTIQLFVDK
ncbi:MAG TPA: OB-fold nucleic acid binding domain-containing protein, partial [Acidimicrobiia bacterium]|nr:OB-fold nucleic acid binding domain-containing protein [Acidimicrobiia bacterium]